MESRCECECKTQHPAPLPGFDSHTNTCCQCFVRVCGGAWPSIALTCTCASWQISLDMGRSPQEGVDPGNVVAKPIPHSKACLTDVRSVLLHSGGGLRSRHATARVFIQEQRASCLHSLARSTPMTDRSHATQQLLASVSTIDDPHLRRALAAHKSR